MILYLIFRSTLLATNKYDYKLSSELCLSYFKTYTCLRTLQIQGQFLKPLKMRLLNRLNYFNLDSQLSKWLPSLIFIDSIVIQSSKPWKCLSDTNLRKISSVFFLFINLLIISSNKAILTVPSSFCMVLFQLFIRICWIFRNALKKV